MLTPNHRLIPDVRWVLDLPEERVVARSDKANAQKGRGTRDPRRAARSSCARGSTPNDDSEADALRNVPPAGYERIATPFYSAYARCA